MRCYPDDIPHQDLVEAHTVLREAWRAHLDDGGSKDDFGTSDFSDQLMVAIARGFATVKPTKPEMRNFDRAWKAIFEDPELEWARNKLSIYELKDLIRRVLYGISQTPDFSTPKVEERKKRV